MGDFANVIILPHVGLKCIWLIKTLHQSRQGGIKGRSCFKENSLRGVVGYTTHKLCKQCFYRDKVFISAFISILLEFKPIT